MRLCAFLRLDFFKRHVHLRYDEADYFRTYCGAFAGLVVVILISLMFLIELIDIYDGKLESYQTIMKNYDNNPNRTYVSSKIEEVVVGLGVSKNLLFSDQGYLTLEFGI